MSPTGISDEKASATASLTVALMPIRSAVLSNSTRSSNA
jgi:hypothetical protein